MRTNIIWLFRYIRGPVGRGPINTKHLLRHTPAWTSTEFLLWCLKGSCQGAAENLHLAWLPVEELPLLDELGCQQGTGRLIYIYTHTHYIHAYIEPRATCTHIQIHTTHQPDMFVQEFACTQMPMHVRLISSSDPLHLCNAHRFRCSTTLVTSGRTTKLNNPNMGALPKAPGMKPGGLVIAIVYHSKVYL